MSKGTTKISELGPEDLKKLRGMLKESTVAKFKIQYFKNALKDIADVAKEELNISTSEFNTQANIAFENDKAQEALDKAEEQYENAVKLGTISETAKENVNRVQQQAYKELESDGMLEDPELDEEEEDPEEETVNESPESNSTGSMFSS